MEIAISVCAIVLIVGGALAYIIHAKKSGRKCIGCPNSKDCSHKCSGCSCTCHSEKTEKSQTQDE